MPEDVNPDPQKTTTNRGDPAPDVNLQPDGSANPGGRAAERGERVETGRQIARGGKQGGDVPGAEEK